MHLIFLFIKQHPLDCPVLSAKLPELADLQDAQAVVQGVHTLPPGGQVSVSAAGIVTVLSFLPAFIDYIVNKLLLPGMGGG